MVHQESSGREFWRGKGLFQESSPVILTMTEALIRIEIRNTERVPLVVTLNTELSSFGKILHNHLVTCTLYFSEKMKMVLLNPPLVASRQLINLKDHLVNTTMKETQQLHEGNSPCENLNAKWSEHTHVPDGMTSKSARTREKFS